MIDNNDKVYLTDITNNPVIMNDRRLWISSVKVILTTMLKDIVDSVVIPFINEKDAQMNFRWNKLI